MPVKKEYFYSNPNSIEAEIRSRLCQTLNINGHVSMAILIESTNQMQSSKVKISTILLIIYYYCSKISSSKFNSIQKSATEFHFSHFMNGLRGITRYAKIQTLHYLNAYCMYTWRTCMHRTQYCALYMQSHTSTRGVQLCNSWLLNMQVLYNTAIQTMVCIN